MLPGKDVDLVQYSVLWQRVQDIDHKTALMERQLSELVSLAKKSRDCFWIGMTLAYFAVGFAFWIVTTVGFK